MSPRAGLPVLLLALLGCDGTETPAPSGPTLSPEEAEARAEALHTAPPPPAPEPVVADGTATLTGTPMEVSAPARVVLVWEGIGQLHKGFFSDAAATQALAEGLGPWLKDTVDVTIRYSSEDMVGDILIKLSPGQLVVPPAVAGDRIRLQDLAPITTALATYRSSVSARFDYRVESFRVRLESYRGARVCQILLAGAPPPDGSLISPCVTVNGQKQCGEPSAEGVLFPSAVAADVRSCLDLP